MRQREKAPCASAGPARGGCSQPADQGSSATHSPSYWLDPVGGGGYGGSAHPPGLNFNHADPYCNASLNMLCATLLRKCTCLAAVQAKLNVATRDLQNDMQQMERIMEARGATPDFLANLRWEGRRDALGSATYNFSRAAPYRAPGPLVPGPVTAFSWQQEAVASSARPSRQPSRRRRASRESAIDNFTRALDEERHFAALYEEHHSADGWVDSSEYGLVDFRERQAFAELVSDDRNSSYTS